MESNRRRQEREGLPKTYEAQRLEEYARLNDEMIRDMLARAPKGMVFKAIGGGNWGTQELDSIRSGLMDFPGLGFTVLKALTRTIASDSRSVLIPGSKWSTKNLEAALEIGQGMQTLDLFYMHFSDINKLGVRPCAEIDESGKCSKTSQYKTPMGVYGYPIAPEFFGQTVEDRIYDESKVFEEQKPHIKPARTTVTVPFAGDRTFVHVYRAKRPQDVLWVNFMLEEDVLEILNKELEREVRVALGYRSQRDSSILGNYLRNHIEDYQGNAIDRETLVALAGRAGTEQARVFTPGGIFWFLTWAAARTGGDDPPMLWGQLMRRLGFEGVVDFSKTPGTAIIHENEPLQAVFFTKPAVEQVESFQLKFPKAHATEGSKLSKAQLNLVEELLDAVNHAYNDLQLAPADYDKAMLTWEEYKASLTTYKNLVGTLQGVLAKIGTY